MVKQKKTNIPEITLLNVPFSRIEFYVLDITLLYADFIDIKSEVNFLISGLINPRYKKRGLNIRLN